MTPASGSTTTDTTPTITGTGDAGSTLTVYSATGAVLGATSVDPSGNWTFTPTTPIPDGTVTFTFTQTDGAGNTSPTATLTFVVNAGPASVQATGGGGGGVPGISWNPATALPSQPTLTVGSLEPTTAAPTDATMPDSTSASVNDAAAQRPGDKTPSERSIIVDGSKRTYTIIDDFAQCPIIDQILDPSYRADFETALVDINRSNIPTLVFQLEKSGVLNGRDDAYFDPRRDISRAEFLKIILRAHCYEYRREDTKTPRFADVTPSSWESQVAELGHKLGIIDGDNEPTLDARVFRPHDPITRAEAIKMLMNIAFIRTARQPATEFMDIATEQWFRPYVSRAEYLDIVNPQEQAYFYRPDAAMTRDGMVHWLTKTIRLYR